MKENRYELLFPREMEENMVRKPIAYVPFGSLEWHCYHMPFGYDAIKAHEICLRVAKKAGGIVLPPSFYGIGGMRYPWTMRFDAELIESLFYAVFEQLSHVGFKVIIAVAGHYPLRQYYHLKKAALEFMQKSNCIVFAGPEYDVATDKGYSGDHAAKWETSLFMALRPELVDMSRLSQNVKETLEGIRGEDPRIHASKELGKETVDIIVNRLAEFATYLLEATPMHRSHFLEVYEKEVTIILRMLELPEKRREEIRLDYLCLLDLIWRRKYEEANAFADKIISSMD